jgi:Fur family zinc uptake transcriptional regulator
MSPSTLSDPEAFHAHDHGACQGEALRAAEEACRARKLRLTPARAFVLETLLESHRAMTAYEVLDRLRAADLGGQPPVAYRALDFLVANGLAHRIERLNAFVACTHGGSEHAAAFLVCRACRRVAESPLPLTMRGLVEEAGASGFAVEKFVVEVEGLCQACRGAGA